ncbi:PepSY domain-containing protein [Rhodococcus oryzae]|uniref:PepSY domain-containing protein n=1 Tax=Rhodococcus oryzae TaxID=2571143 RepID=A0ABY2RF75_9NOCA|nr:PepSY domain-containing protein [Rhodococcus oryzae]TJZ74407.1 PepSY domain-containing protein [Rhodococcus oryzae]
MTITTEPGVPKSTPPGTESQALRKLLLRLHFYAGVFVGPFLLVAALTGFIYAFAPTLEKLAYGNYLEAPASDSPLPASEQLQAALDGRDPSTLLSLQTAEAGGSTRVVFADPSVGSGETTVFVDPGSGKVLGALATDSGDLPLRAWLSALHKNLHLGEVGNLYSELAASWLGVIALAGLYLWWTKYRRDRANGNRGRLLTVDRSVTGRRSTLNWHGVVGACAAIGLIFLSITGLTWSDHAGKNVKTVRTEMSWTTPKLDTTLAASAAAPADEHAGHGAPAAPVAEGAPVDPSAVDGVLTVARDQGLTGSLSATIPAGAATAWTVKETATGGDSIAVDAATMQVTDEQRFADWPLAAKLSQWGIAGHMGTLFGFANQLLLGALALSLITLLVTGYWMWWQRRPRRSEGFALGTMPRRGALRRLPWPAIGGIAVVAVAVGIFVPLLGLSLLGFLIVDVLLGLRSRRQPA